MTGPRISTRRRAARTARTDPLSRRQRKLVMQALNTDHLRKFFDRLDQVAARLQRRWQKAAHNGALVDVPSDLKRFTVDVTSGLAFGTDLNTLEDEGDVIQHYWARARLMELVCRGLTNKEIRPRVVHQSKNQEARARRPPETRTRAPSTGVLSRVCSRDCGRAEIARGADEAAPADPDFPL